MWRDKFRQQCQDLFTQEDGGHVGSSSSTSTIRARNRRTQPRRRLEPARPFMPHANAASGGSIGHSEMVDDGDDVDDEVTAQQEHEEIFRRMMLKEKRQQEHRALLSFEREVGGSDPDILEMDIRAAEEAGDEAHREHLQQQQQQQTTSPNAPLLVDQSAQPGTIWRYRQPPDAHHQTYHPSGVPISSPLAHTGHHPGSTLSGSLNPGQPPPLYRNSSTNASTVTSSTRPLPPPYLGTQASSTGHAGDETLAGFDEEELERMMQIEQEEMDMIEQYENASDRYQPQTSPQSTHPTTQVASVDGLTWAQFEQQVRDQPMDDVDMT